MTPGELTSTGLAPFIGVGVLLPRDRAKPSRCPMALSEAGSRLPFSPTVEFLALGGGRLWLFSPAQFTLVGGAGQILYSQSLVPVGAAGFSTGEGQGNKQLQQLLPPLTLGLPDSSTL